MDSMLEDISTDEAAVSLSMRYDEQRLPGSTGYNYPETKGFPWTAD